MVYVVQHTELPLDHYLQYWQRPSHLRLLLDLDCACALHLEDVVCTGRPSLKIIQHVDLRHKERLCLLPRLGHCCY